MRIGINGITFSLHESGVGRYVRGLLSGLARVGEGHEFVLYIEDGFFKTIPALPDNFRVLRFEKGWFKNHILFTSTILPLLALRERFDILHITNPVFYPGGRHLTAVTVHDINEFIIPSAYPLLKKLYRKWVVSHHIRGGRVIFTDSLAAGIEIEKRFKVDPVRVKSIQLGVEPIFFPRDRRESEERVKGGYGISTPYILYVGRIDVPVKNLINVLKGFSQALPHLPPDLTFVLSGMPGFRAGEVYSFVREKGLSERVRFTGLVPDRDLPYLISSSVCLVALSISEGFGLPPLEAMACGRSAIVSRVSSFPEVVEDAGIQVDPEDTGEIAHAMERMVLDAELRKGLELRALERAKRFTWENTAATTLLAYREFCS